MAALLVTSTCPCQSGATYAACCGRYLDGGARPDTAEQLMRSRYCAYVLARADYLLATWHASTRPPALDLGTAEPGQWLGLKILRTEAGGAGDERGLVEFVARYKGPGRAQRLHEASRFVKEAGQWFYLDGELAST
jgi:SEC-C motif-containing protein